MEEGHHIEMNFRITEGYVYTNKFSTKWWFCWSKILKSSSTNTCIKILSNLEHGKDVLLKQFHCVSSMASCFEIDILFFWNFIPESCKLQSRFIIVCCHPKIKLRHFSLCVIQYYLYRNFFPNHDVIQRSSSKQFSRS